MSARPLPRSDTGEVAELLREILARLDRIEARLGGRKAPGTSTDEELVRCLREAFAEEPFYAWEVLDAATQPGGEALTAALCGASAKRLGKCLRRLEGANLGGLRVVRVAESRDGAIRKVEEVAPVR